MTKAVNIEGIEAATNRPWKEWVTYFESVHAQDLSHKEIAEHAYQELTANQASRGWWAQSLAVAYEQHIGRRKPGQRSDGTYEVSVTKMFPGSMDAAMQAWLQLVKEYKEFSGVAIAKPPTTSQTDKRRRWGCSLADGSRVIADVSRQKPGKVILAIAHQKLPSQTTADAWRVYWKELLSKLFSSASTK